MNQAILGGGQLAKGTTCSEEKLGGLIYTAKYKEEVGGAKAPYLRLSL